MTNEKIKERLQMCAALINSSRDYVEEFEQNGQEEEMSDELHEKYVYLVKSLDALDSWDRNNIEEACHEII